MPQDRIAAEHVEFAHFLADEARRILSSHQDELIQVGVKLDRSLVTEMDVMIEKRLRELIADRYPDHGVIGEELDWERPDAEAVWVLDPIDGTSAFIAGSPSFGTLIALAIEGIPRLGVIDAPAIDARWLGAEGRPTVKNGRAIRVKSCSSLDAVLMTNSNQDYLSASEKPALERLRQVTGARIYGGSCLNYGHLSDGRTDLAIDGGQKVFDFAPYRPIVEGAGGTITDWAGQPLTLKSCGRVLGAGDRIIHGQVVELLSELNID